MFYNKSVTSNFMMIAAVVVLLAILSGEWTSLVTGSPAQTFYPNGRYGKRTVSPLALDSISGMAGDSLLDELDGTSLGGQPLKCHYLGYGDLFKCRSVSSK